VSVDDQSVKLFAPPPAEKDNVRAKLSEGGVQPLPCTGCIIDGKQAAMLGKDIPEPLPGTVMINGMLLCDVRHTLNVGAPQLLVAQPGQIPGGLG